MGGGGGGRGGGGGCAGGEKPLVVSESVAPRGLRCCSGSFSKPSAKSRREAAAAPLSQAQEKNSFFSFFFYCRYPTRLEQNACKVEDLQSRCSPRSAHQPRTTDPG